MLRQLSLLTTAFSFAALSLFAQSNDHVLFGSYAEAQGGQGLVYAISPDGAGYQTILEFPSNPDGQNPSGELLSSGDGYLYGVTQAGGDSNGTVFEIKEDGTGFKVIYTFADAGIYPLGGLVWGIDGQLYGIGSPRNVNDGGTIYRIHRDGSDYTTVYSFGNTRLGNNSKLAIDSDGTIYGIGASFIISAIFKLNPDGTGFTILHNFDGLVSPQIPNVQILMASNGYIYGTTQYDGANSKGTVFRMHKDGTSFEIVLDFPGTFVNPPDGNLVELDNAIYGSAELAYTGVFKINLDGSGYNLIASGPQFGAGTAALSVTNDGKLIVVSRGGGTNGQGIISRVNTDGTNFTLLTEIDFDFNTYPAAVLPNGDLMGVRNHGYESQNGCIYQVPSAGGLNLLKEFGQPDGAQPMGNLIYGPDGLVYGLTQKGGSTGTGVVYRMKKDGTNYQVIHDIDRTWLNYVATDHTGLLLASDGFIYATTDRQPNSMGTIYKLSMDGQSFEEIFAFGGASGEIPTGTLLEASDGKLYGMTMNGGTFGWGVVYKINKDGTGFQTLYSFDTPQPQGGSLAEGTGGYVFGMVPTSSGGFLFRIKTDGTGYAKTDFGTGIGSALPGASLVKHPDGRLYGMTGQYSGVNGIIFSIASDGTDFQTEYSLGESTANSLALSEDGYLYGLTTYGWNFFKFKDVTSGSQFLPLVPGFSSLLLPLQPKFLILETDLQGITFSMIATATMLDETITLTGTADSALPITYLSDNHEVATIEGNTLTIVGAGVANITATQPGNIFTRPATPVSVELTVFRVPQIITFDPLPEMTPADLPFDLIATSTSGLTVTFGSTDETVATITGTQLTIVGDGTTTIIACQEGSNIYLAATCVQRELTVSKIPQTITFASLVTRTFGEPSFQLTGTSTSELAVTYTSSDVTVATVAGAQLTIVGAGTTTITASQAGTHVYEAAADVSQEFTVEIADQTITFGDIPAKVLGSGNFTLNATASSELVVAYTTTSDKVTIAGNSVTLVKSGRLTIKADQAGNDNYTPAASVERSFCINPPTPTITLTAVSDGVTLTSSNDDGNQWYRNGTLIADATAKTLSVTEPDAFTVITTTDDCASATSETMNVIVTGIESGPQGDGVTVYPNPVSQFLMVVVSSGHEEDLNIELIDVLGKPVGTWLVRTNREEKLDVSHLTGGMYLLHMKGGGMYVVKKVYKK